MYESLERFKVVMQGWLLQRIEITSPFIRANGNGWAASAKQEQVHQESCRSPIAVREWMNCDQLKVRVKTRRRARHNPGETFAELPHKLWNLQRIRKDGE